jgi:hypothetical protein
MLNKFQMIAEEMKKKGFKPLPKETVANGEFETLIRKDFHRIKSECKTRTGTTLNNKDTNY